MRPVDLARDSQYLFEAGPPFLRESDHVDDQPRRRGGITGKGFVPGCSGNPKGYSKAAARARQLAAEMSAEALHYCLSVVRDEKASRRDRLAAASIIINRGHADRGTKGEPTPEGHVFVVRQVTGPIAPVSGVLNSPIREHITTAHQLPAPAETISATIA